MSAYDDDPVDPLDVTSVAADHEVVERLRRSLSPTDAVVWDEDEDAGQAGEDRSYAMLLALQRDVTRSALPSAPALGAARVVPLAGRRRGVGRTAAVAAVTTGVLALGGAAAAATSGPGDAMYGVRSALASAVQQVVDAITPTEPVGPRLALPAAATPTATIAPPGAATSASARSASAVRQIEERISTAKRLLAAGRAKPALQVLDQAARRLPLVTDVVVRAELAKQVRDLRTAAAALAGQRGHSTQPRDERPAPADKGAKRPASKPSRTPAAGSRGGDADSGGRSSSRTQGARRAPVRSELPTAAQLGGRRDDVDR